MLFKRLLIVDDVAFNIDFEERLIHSLAIELGIEARINTAKSVEEAIEMIEINPPYDAMIIDMNLPDGSGVEVAKKARSLSENTRLAALTIYPDQYEKERPYFDLFMKKPISINDFKQNFVRLLQI